MLDEDDQLEDARYTKKYTYELYKKVYRILNGETIHYLHSRYIKTGHLFLERADFEAKFAKLQELELTEPENPANPDEWESISYLIGDLESELFLMERLNPYFICELSSD